MRGPTWGPQPTRACLGELVRPGVLWALGAPPLVLFAPEIQKYSEKNRIKFSGHSENFYFWVIFLLQGESRKQDNPGFLFYLTKNNRKQKVGTEGCAY